MDEEVRDKLGDGGGGDLNLGVVRLAISSFNHYKKSPHFTIARTKIIARKISKGGKAKTVLPARKSLPKGKTVTQHPPAPKKYHLKWATNALQEIRRYQKSIELVIPKLPFQRLVREITQNITTNQIRFQALAIQALQEACEAFLVKEFEMTNLVAIHAHRVTIQPRDMRLVERLRKIMNRSSFQDEI
ncbi:centromeric histone H3 htr12, putative [Talaromyces stipitatus ATCC 10500]|uniref:Histone H3 n=1 Tax=Talaromyces stipitatus (strain ATCC 10500 / CBS 375.48 / QM 6759 / NRRL 1006) TaxID=441959 RepID=B8LYR5_TALSN|nr:centromeric histone H3 htr12, putative [Talaromyces stipitatus ATCC 10500]EED23423.1 centromeric histone H3 htr12, putative [Talaromyces stipitatus ATCC 10500]